MFSCLKDVSWSFWWPFYNQFLVTNVHVFLNYLNIILYNFSKRHEKGELYFLRVSSQLSYMKVYNKKLMTTHLCQNVEEAK